MCVFFSPCSLPARPRTIHPPIRPFTHASLPICISVHNKDKEPRLLPACEMCHPQLDTYVVV